MLRELPGEQLPEAITELSTHYLFQRFGSEVRHTAQCLESETSNTLLAVTAAYYSQVEEYGSNQSN